MMRGTVIVLLGIAGCCPPRAAIDPWPTIRGNGAVLYVLEVEESFWDDSGIFENGGRRGPKPPTPPDDQNGIVLTSGISVEGLQQLLRWASRPEIGISLVGTRHAQRVDRGWMQLTVMGEGERPEFHVQFRAVPSKNAKYHELDYTLFRRDPGEEKTTLFENRITLSPFASFAIGYAPGIGRNYLLVLFVASVNI